MHHKTCGQHVWYCEKIDFYYCLGNCLIFGEHLHKSVIIKIRYTMQCVIVGCSLEAVNGRSGCTEHTCACGVNLKIQTGNGCKSCNCAKKGCPLLRQGQPHADDTGPLLATSQSRFCNAHACSECYENETFESPFCRECKCSVSGCPCAKMENSDGCIFHTCKSCKINIRWGFYTVDEVSDFNIRAFMSHDDDYYARSRTPIGLPEIKGNAPCTDFCQSCKCKAKDCSFRSRTNVASVERLSQIRELYHGSGQCEIMTYCVLHTCGNCNEGYKNTDETIGVCCRCIMCPEIIHGKERVCYNHLCENCHSKIPDVLYPRSYSANETERHKYCKDCKCRGNNGYCKNKIVPDTRAAEIGVCPSCLCSNCENDYAYPSKKYCTTCSCIYCDTVAVKNKTCEAHLCLVCHDKPVYRLLFSTYFRYCTEHMCQHDWRQMPCDNPCIDEEIYCENHIKLHPTKK